MNPDVILALAGVAILYVGYQWKKRQDLKQAEQELNQKLSNLIPLQKAFKDLQTGADEARKKYEKDRNDFNSKYPSSDDSDPSGGAK